MGLKRGSPGAEEEKAALTAHLSEEDAEKLNEIRREIAKIDLFLERQELAKYAPAYEKRRKVTKAISNFWPAALMNHQIIVMNVQHNFDQTALNYLEDVWVTRDPEEPRAFTIEFTFKENPYFHDTVLKKEFKYVPSKQDDNPELHKPDENGITEAMLEFDWSKDIEPLAIKINWKDPTKALTKLYPRVMDESEDDIPAEGGSFFNFFEEKTDPFNIGGAIATEVFPSAIEYFLNDVDNSEVDSDEEDEEDDDEEAEIDLEKPRQKKTRV